MRGLFLAMAITGVAISAAPVAAQEDEQVWVSTTVTTDVGARGVLTVESQLRLTDEAARAGQFIFRPSLGLKLTDSTTVSVGYALVETEPQGRPGTTEHRAWQQAAYRLAGSGQGATLTARTRLEQRWLEGAEGMGWRLRQQLRLTAPLAGRARAVAWSEAFVGLDDTTWGQRSGLERLRNFGGISLPLGQGATIEPGYLNQWIRRSGRDRMDHVASVAISARL